MYIAVDFDGSIVTEAWPGIGRLRFMARIVLQWLKRRGHVLILNTCRRDQYLTWARMFLNDRGIRFDYFNENPPERTEAFGGDCRKISADIYIDDKAIGYWNWPIVFILFLVIELVTWLQKCGDRIGRKYGKAKATGQADQDP